jgi:putative methyltransferase (TIGR04325 family)
MVWPPLRSWDDMMRNYPVKSFMRELVPPILLAFARPARRKQGYYFSGDYRSWGDASAAAGQGWGSPGILEKVRASALKAKHGEVAFERDSVTFTVSEFRWPLLACIFQAALSSKSQGFHVLDFGGSLGSTYLQHRVALNDISGLRWSIVEQSHYVQCGRNEFEDDILHFFDNVPAALHRGNIDLAIFSGSLQCVAAPYEVIGEVSKCGARYLLFDRMPIIPGKTDVYTVQHVYDVIYTARYPHRCFAKELLFSSIGALGYEITQEFSGYDSGPRFAQYIGLFCRRR